MMFLPALRCCGRNWVWLIMSPWLRDTVSVVTTGTGLHVAHFFLGGILLSLCSVTTLTAVRKQVAFLSAEWGITHQCKEFKSLRPAPFRKWGPKTLPVTSQGHLQKRALDGRMSYGTVGCLTPHTALSSWHGHAWASTLCWKASRYTEHLIPVRHCTQSLRGNWACQRLLEPPRDNSRGGVRCSPVKCGLRGPHDGSPLWLFNFRPGTPLCGSEAIAFWRNPHLRGTWTDSQC